MPGSSADVMSNRETPGFDPSGVGLDTRHPQAALDRVKTANDLISSQHARMVLPDGVVIQAQSRRGDPAELLPILSDIVSRARQPTQAGSNSLRVADNLLDAANRG